MAIDLNGSTGISLDDNEKINIGNDSDLQIYHDGSHSYIAEGGSATGSLRIRGENLLLEDNSGKDYLNAVADAQVELSHNGVKKFETTSTGVTVTGSGDAILLLNTASDAGDKSLIRFGDNNDADAGYIDYDHGTNSLAFGANAAERMRIDSSGRLLLGTTTSFADGNSENLQIAGSGNTGMIIKSGTANYGSIYFGDATSGDARNAGIVRYFHNDNSMQFWTSEGERVRIDSNGNVLVGKTSSSLSNNGVELQANGTSLFTRSVNSGDGAGVAYFQRNTSDGNIIMLYNSSTSNVGVIGVSGGNPYFSTKGGSNQCGIMPVGGSDPRVTPVNASGSPLDNGADLGYSNARWDDIWATNGSIQTSDFNEKQNIASLTATEMLVGARISALFKTFRWKDSVAEKGDNARTHTGVIAQDVQSAFTAEGLDAGDYALFISSTWWEHDVNVPAVEAVAEVTDEDGNITTEAVEAVDAYTRTDTYYTEDEAPEGATEKTRLGIRYPELLSFVAAYNEQRFASIEARLTALEA